jgi:hypothetical protein
LSDQTLSKTGTSQPGGGCPGWEIASGKLQVKNFGAFVGTCSFTMPLTDLAAAANQKYQSVTLAVVQTGGFESRQPSRVHLPAWA